MAALTTGLTGVIAALSAFLANRSKTTAANQKLMRSRIRKLEKQNVDLISHVYRLEIELAKHGATLPPRPPSVDEPFPGEVEDFD